MPHPGLFISLFWFLASYIASILKNVYIGNVVIDWSYNARSTTPNRQTWHSESLLCSLCWNSHIQWMHIYWLYHWCYFDMTGNYDMVVNNLTPQQWQIFSSTVWRSTTKHMIPSKLGRSRRESLFSLHCFPCWFIIIYFTRIALKNVILSKVVSYNKQCNSFEKIYI